jgi:hypothetical protein
MPVTAGITANVYRFADDTVEFPLLDPTVTSTVPAEWAGAVAVIAVPSPLAAYDGDGVPPNQTPLVSTKPFPVIMTEFPPPVGPETGEMPVTAGADW